jgi:HAD superfamily hydrolase (TIGR01490 family)
MRKFAVFDIDGTLIRWQLYHAVADALARQGHIKPEVYQSIKDARMAWKRRSGGSFKDYELQVIEVYEAILVKLSAEQFESAANAVFEEYKDQVYTYTRDLIAKLKKKGYLLFAISGSQSEIVARIADYYGFDDFVGTVYTRSKTGFSGQKTIGSLKKLVSRHKATYDSSVGVGDSRSDIPMLKLVDMAIALNPEAELFEAASQHGWKIVIERKNMVYELEKRNGKYQLAKTNV